MKNGNGHTKTLDLKPHSADAEKSVLGSLLIDPDAMLYLAPFLQSDDFYIERHRWVFEAIKSLYEQRAPADLVTVSNELRKAGQLDEIGGEAYLTRLMNVTPTSIHAEWYGRIVEKDAVRRRLLDAAGEIARLAHTTEIDDPDELLGKAESHLLDVLNNRVEGNIKSSEQIVEQVYKHIERVCNAKGITGLPTGLTDLDYLLGGLQRSDMIVLAGRPGMGKTALATQIGKYACQKYDKRVLMFSLEMSAEQLMQRMIASECGIDTNRLRTGNIRHGEWSGFFTAQDRLSKLKFDIDDSPALTPGMMRSKAIRHHAHYGIDLVIIDYLQLMSTDQRGQNRNQEIAEISRACKILARELNVPVIALSQLSRNVEYRADKRPNLADLRESGAIEADADVVVFTYRDEIYNPETEFAGVAELIVGKHRSGPTGIVSVYFRKHLTQFMDLEMQKYQLQQID